MSYQKGANAFHPTPFFSFYCYLEIVYVVLAYLKICYTIIVLIMERTTFAPAKITPEVNHKVKRNPFLNPNPNRNPNPYPTPEIEIQIITLTLTLCCRRYHRKSNNCRRSKCRITESRLLKLWKLRSTLCNNLAKIHS